MPDSQLLLDVGNTRLKWARCVDGQIHESGAIAHDDAPDAVLQSLPRAAYAAVWIAQVRGDGGAFADHVAAQFGARVQRIHSAAQWRTLRNAYAEPQRLGVDRWLAMVGAWAQAPRALCIVDAGTALTVDVINASGQHQGGLIVAGLAVQPRVLLGHTAIAARPLAPISHSHLGTDTESCIHQGALLACLGAIDRASAQAGAHADTLICGGDALRLLPHLGAGWQHRPHLVLEGLAALSQATRNTTAR